MLVVLATATGHAQAPIDWRAVEAETLQHFKALVQIDTSNPPGNESRAVDYVKQVLERTRFEEVIVSTLPERVSHWLRRDLPRRVAQLGIPVTVVTAKQSSREIT